jgi:hypothetical protein
MMANCSVCSHPQVADINRLLLAGVPKWEIEMVFFVSKDALGRHYRRHLSKEVQP